jgi:prophage regulatory protein
MATTPSHTILRRRRVEARVGLSRSTIYAMIQRGEFPAPVRPTTYAVGWKESDIDRWLASRAYRSAPDKEVRHD